MNRRDVAVIALGLLAGFALIVLALHSAYVDISSGLRSLGSP